MGNQKDPREKISINSVYRNSYSLDVLFYISLQLAIDEIRKKEDYVSATSSSEEDSSSEGSDSESATVSFFIL